MNKRWFLVIGLVLILGLAGLVGCSSGGVSGEVAQLSINSQQQGIWVNGIGEVSDAPDIATVRLGIEAEADTVAEAQADATAAMNDVLDALKDNGIADKDIQVQQYSIYRMTDWDREKEESVVTGFRVTHMVTAKIRDIEKAGEIIDDVVAAGGDLTRIDNVGFSIDDPSDYYDEAREAAVKNAKDKAEQLAGLAGVSLGKATYISENSYYAPVVRAGYDMAMEESAMGGTTISPGELEISVNIQVAYAIK
jgi:uncharacterized protein YggE